MRHWQPNVKQFDETRAKQELKSCPKIVRDYVKLLNEHYDRQKDLTAKAIGKLKSQSQWISVKDELPEDVTTVMVYRRSDHPKPFEPYRVDIMNFSINEPPQHGSSAGHTDYSFWQEYRHDHYDLTHLVTHWQPLPQPPKE